MKVIVHGSSFPLTKDDKSFEPLPFDHINVFFGTPQQAFFPAGWTPDGSTKVMYSAANNSSFFQDHGVNSVSFWGDGFDFYPDMMTLMLDSIQGGAALQPMMENEGEGVEIFIYEDLSGQITELFRQTFVYPLYVPQLFDGGKNLFLNIFFETFKVDKNARLYIEVKNYSAVPITSFNGWWTGVIRNELEN